MNTPVSKLTTAFRNKAGEIAARYERHVALVKQYEGAPETLRKMRDRFENNGIFYVLSEEKHFLSALNMSISQTLSKARDPFSFEHKDEKDLDLRWSSFIYGCNDLINVDLRNVDLREASFSGAFLDGAKLKRSDLRKSIWTGTSTKGTDLRGADLREAVDLTEEQITAAIIDEDTQLDYKFDRLKVSILNYMDNNPSTAENLVILPPSY
ncbi:MAG TPA: hypothetical protein DEA55_09530 [Rhodospirillaceae bacterium]|nr:hypothetical protein [Rhodospirillaceae bacterium]